jgi:hypothetical protein
MRNEIAAALVADAARRFAIARAQRVERNRAEIARIAAEDGNEMEPIYRAQDAAHEARYGPRD